jgi:hypothetical protein
LLSQTRSEGLLSPSLSWEKETNFMVGCRAFPTVPAEIPQSGFVLVRPAHYLPALVRINPTILKNHTAGALDLFFIFLVSFF